MTTNDPTTQTLAELGAITPERVIALFAEVRNRFDEQLATVTTRPENRDVFRVHWVGRKSGTLTRIADNWLRRAPTELKQPVGQAFNELKSHIDAQLQSWFAAINEFQDTGANAAAIHSAYAARDAATATAAARAVIGWGGQVDPILPPLELLDLSLPGIERAIGTRHLIRQTYDELLRIFTAIGFSVVAGPEIETPYYNFEALNIPEHHPARDNMDTFYIAGARGGHLLRTHTSPMQIRTMEKQKPPVRIVVPGKVYRRDNPDATHGYMFHQIEGLAVDTDITFCDFKGTVDYFVREFLGPQNKNAPAAQLFSVHRAFRRSGRDLPCMRRHRLPRVQTIRLDRTLRRGHGESRRVRIRELRS